MDKQGEEIAAFNTFLGLHPKDVVDQLKTRGFVVEILETRPPGDAEGIGDKRVIAIKFKQNKKNCKIIWCYEDYD